MYNLELNDTKEISFRYTRYVSNPDISENILSYTGGAGSNTIYCANLSDEDECTHVIEDTIFSVVKEVKTYDNVLAWISKENDIYNIKYYDISNRQKEEKTNCIDMYGYLTCYISCHYIENKSDIKTIHTGKDIDNIAFYKNLIAWQEKNSDWDILYYDLSSNKTTKVVKNSADQINPSVSSRYIVWQDYRNGNWDIYAYDLINKKEIQITNSPQNETNPVVFWKRIAWLQDNNIYTCVVK